jgi:hypothetical protein
MQLASPLEAGEVTLEIAIGGRRHGAWSTRRWRGVRGLNRALGQLQIADELRANIRAFRMRDGIAVARGRRVSVREAIDVAIRVTIRMSRMPRGRTIRGRGIRARHGATHELRARDVGPQLESTDDHFIGFLQWPVLDDAFAVHPGAGEAALVDELEATGQLVDLGVCARDFPAREHHAVTRTAADRHGESFERFLARRLAVFDDGESQHVYFLAFLRFGFGSRSSSAFSRLCFASLNCVVSGGASGRTMRGVRKITSSVLLRR